MEEKRTGKESKEERRKRKEEEEEEEEKGTMCWVHTARCSVSGA